MLNSFSLNKNLWVTIVTKILKIVKLEGYEEKQTVVINKYRYVFSVKMIGLIADLILNFISLLILLSNHFFKMNSTIFTSYMFLSIIWLFGINKWIYKHIFYYFIKKENRRKENKNLAMIHMIQIFIYGIPFYLNLADYIDAIMQVICVVVIYISMLLLYLVRQCEKIDKNDIIIFETKTESIGTDDDVDMITGVKIILKNSNCYPINLYFSNILIKENDDILIYINENKREKISLNKKGGLSQTKVFPKQEICFIKFGKEKLIYDKINGWMKK